MYGRRVNLYVVPPGPGDSSRPAGRTSGLGEDRAVEAAELAELMTLSARGHEDAFAQLYDRTSSRVYGVVWRVLRSTDHAAEVTQEVYTEVWRQASRFDVRKGSVFAWMTTMAHRRAVDRVRSVTSEVARDEHYAVAETVRDVDHVWEGVEERLDAERVREGLQVLTTLQREVLTLAYFGGYTQNQIAALLDVPLGTVKTRVRDALTRLRRALDDDSTDGGGRS